MFFLNLLKILFLFFIIYFIYNIMRGVLIVRRKMKEPRPDTSFVNKGKNGDKIIELDKDQYKVE